MTPEQAESIYYQAMRDYRWDGREPLDEAKRRAHSWQAVIDAVERPWKELVAQRVEEDARQ